MLMFLTAVFVCTGFAETALPASTQQEEDRAVCPPIPHQHVFVHARFPCACLVVNELNSVSQPCSAIVLAASYHILTV